MLSWHLKKKLVNKLKSCIFFFERFPIGQSKYTITHMFDGHIQEKMSDYYYCVVL